MSESIVKNYLPGDSKDEPEILQEDRIKFMESVNRLIQKDSSVVDPSSQRFKNIVDNLILCLSDENTEVSEMSREILRHLIKNYKKFADIIPKLSFVNRQDLLYVIGKTDFLFRSTLNFSGFGGLKSQSLTKKIGLTSENQEITSKFTEESPSISDLLHAKRKRHSKDFKKNCFGVIPFSLISQLEFGNLYEDRLRALTKVSRKYVVDNDNFELLSKHLNEFVSYLFDISHEEAKNEVESLSYESIVIFNKILNKDAKYLEALDFKLCFSNLLSHSKTLDKPLLNEVISAFKTLKRILGHEEYDKYSKGSLDTLNNSRIVSVLDVYGVILEDMKKSPKKYDYESTIKALSKISKNLKNGQMSSQAIDKIFKLINTDDKKSKTQAYKLLEDLCTEADGSHKIEKSRPFKKKSNKSMHSSSSKKDEPLSLKGGSSKTQIKITSITTNPNLKKTKKPSMYSSNIILSDQNHSKDLMLGRKEMMNIHSSMGNLHTIEENMPVTKRSTPSKLKRHHGRPNKDVKSNIKEINGKRQNIKQIILTSRSSKTLGKFYQKPYRNCKSGLNLPKKVQLECLRPLLETLNTDCLLCTKLKREVSINLMHSVLDLY
ncbi:unnamed protein product [Moneuplotes crassus]|uniref:Uncharacterized protein n=1 Tax=Euplotes crassus TaxID=5936 RepID=A0AAD1U3H9_EUPCR|nr:unnamed protein product [Moneuplotes crassus]